MHRIAFLDIGGWNSRNSKPDTARFVSAYAAGAAAGSAAVLLQYFAVAKSRGEKSFP